VFVLRDVLRICSGLLIRVAYVSCVVLVIRTSFVVTAGLVVRKQSVVHAGIRLRVSSRFLVFSAYLLVGVLWVIFKLRGCARTFVVWGTDYFFFFFFTSQFLIVNFAPLAWVSTC
jgi:hypothetical protein